jgi:hypothetical protein
MLTDIQRAAMMPNPAGIVWFHHLQSRFVGEIRGARGANQFALEIQQFTTAAGAHAEFTGLIEVGDAGILPVVTEIQGALDLENRELRFAATAKGEDGDNFAGRFSENGRVLELRWNAAAGKLRALVLVHEQTLSEFLDD